jgi:hypothetical protein
MAQLYDKFADEQALEAQKEKVLALFEEIKQGVKSLSSLGITLDNSQSKKEVDELLKATERLKKLQGDYGVQLAATKLQQQEVNKANKEAAKDVLGLNDAYSKLSKQYEQAARNAQNLAITLGKDAEETKKAAAEAKALGDQLKETDATVGKFQRNVGNYANSLAGGFDKVSAEISRLKNEQQGLQDLTNKPRTVITGFGPPDQNLNQAEAQLKNVTAALQQLEQVQAIGANTTIGFTQKVKQLEKEYQNLVSSGTQTNEFLQEFKKFVGNAKDQTEDLKAEIKALSSDTFVFDQIASGVKTMTAVFQVGASVAQLFGANQEDVQRSIQKLIIIQNVANGVQEIANQLTLRGSIINKGYVFIQGLLTTAFNTSATAAARFNAALGLIGIAATVIGAIAIAFAAFKKSAEDAATSNSLLLKTMQDSNSEYTTAVKLVNGLRINIDLAKKGFLDKKDVVKEYNDTIGKTTGKVKTLDEAEKELTKNGGSYIQMTLLKAAANLALEEAAAKALQIEKNRIKSESGFAAIEEGGVARAEALKKALQDPEYIRLTKEAEAAFWKSGTTENSSNQEKKLAAQYKAQADKLFAERDKIISDLIEQSRDKELKQELASATQIAASFQERAAIILKGYKPTPLYDDKDMAKKDDKSGDIQKEIAETEGISLKYRLAALDKYVTARTQILLNSNLSDEEFVLRSTQLNNEAAKIFDDIVGGSLNVAEAATQKIAEEATIDLQAVSAEFDSEWDTISAGIVSKIKEVGKILSEEEKKQLQETKNNYTDVFQEIVNSAGNVISGVLDAEKYRIQDQINNIDKLKTAEIDRINSSTDGEEKRAAKIKIIESKAQIDRDNLEKRQKQVIRQRAISERAFKAFQITTDTIQGVNKIRLLIAAAPDPISKALYISQLVLAIASGAGALVSLLATPIPKFFKGTDHSPEGLAEVAEQGPELAVDASGKAKVYDKHTLTYLSRGTKIFPADVTKAMINAAEIDRAGMMKSFHNNVNVSVSDNRDLLQSTLGELKELNKKSRIVIINNAAVETSAWYQQQMKH